MPSQDLFQFIPQKVFTLYSHGRIRNTEFEAWLYQVKNLANLMGESNYLELLELDFKTEAGAQISREWVFQYADTHWREDLFSLQTCEAEISRFEATQSLPIISQRSYYIASQPIHADGVRGEVSGKNFVKLQDSHFPIWMFDQPGSEKPKGLDPLPLKIAQLLDFALSYPPALAIARECANRWSSGTQQEVLVAYAYLVLKHLEQKDSFVKAISLDERTVYRNLGESYWIVAADLDTVQWVSSDFFIYTDPTDSFALKTGDLVSLPNLLPSDFYYKTRLSTSE